MAFAATPIFLIMAVIAYAQYPPLCTVSGKLGFLSSMWLMYGIMGAVHSGPWLSLAREQLKNATPRQSGHKKDRVRQPGDP
jgi:hypothetical protein